MLYTREITKPDRSRGGLVGEESHEVPTNTLQAGAQTQVRGAERGREVTIIYPRQREERTFPTEIPGDSGNMKISPLMRDLE